LTLLFCSLIREPELQEFIGLKTQAEKLSYRVSEALRSAVDRFVKYQVSRGRVPDGTTSIGSILATTVHGLSLNHSVAWAWVF
jgi:hypothetical protein